MDRIIEKKKWTTKKIIQLVSAGVFLIFLIFFIFFRDNKSKLNINVEQIRIATVEKSKFQEFIPVDGVVQPIRTVFIDAIQGGNIEKIFVEDGAILKAGDTILKLSNPNMELDYMNRETNMYEVLNNLHNTKLTIEQSKFNRAKEITDLSYQVEMASVDFERKKKFFKQNVVSKEEYENAERDYKYLQKQKKIALSLQKLDSVANITRIAQIDATINRMTKNLELLKENLGSLYIKAPINGQLSSFNVEIGETKTAGQNLGHIDVTNNYKLITNIDERYITRVFIGQEAEFNFSGKKYIIEIAKIYTQVRNGSFQVDLIFPNEAPGSIKRGQTLQLRLKFSSATDAIIVKRGGFFQETGGNWIYIIDDDNKIATKRKIKIGRQNTCFYEVLDGLMPGEKVIISSYDNFGDKDVLILKNK
ncbi:MAG: HlyD family efflux transporter periplasmic adaptor subunit [Bacteroidales bacterium]|nr:HlyD family efflux transporter periplasmic adaptor subunit [Bacteroidales bacterium]